MEVAVTKNLLIFGIYLSFLKLCLEYLQCIILNKNFLLYTLESRIYIYIKKRFKILYPVKVLFT